MNPWIGFILANCLLLIPIIAYLDADVERGMQFRRDEFNNLDDDEYRKNIELINNRRHLGEEWSVESNCRVNSAELSEKQCINPNTLENNKNGSIEMVKINIFSKINPPKCFSAQINYQYVDRSGVFGEFPEQLEFLRHFPRCWLRLAPLVCLGHFRPCVLSTKNSQQTKYVLLQQFPAAVCRNMLDHCPFAAAHLLQRRNKFPSYLNCEAHLYGRKMIRNGGNGTEEITKKSAIYIEDCKVNEITKQPELAALAEHPFQCLWPLVKMVNEYAYAEGANWAKPLIDACYMPCQTPMFSSDALQIYQNFFAIFWLIQFTLFVIFFFILNWMHAQEKEKAEIQKHQQQHFSPIKTFPLAFSITLICTLIALCLITLIFCLSIFPIGRHHILGEFSTCLSNERNSTVDGGQHRRSNGFQMAEGKDNAFCAIHASFLDFFYNFANFTLFLLYSKMILLRNLPLSNNSKFILNFLPKWNSPMLPIAPLFFGIFTVLLDLFFNEISMDPVNGMCHFFLNKLLTARILCPFIAFIVVIIFVCYANSVSSSKRRKKIREGWSGNNNSFNGRNSKRNFAVYTPVTTTTTTTTMQFQQQGYLEQNAMTNQFGPEENRQKNEQEIPASIQNESSTAAPVGIGISLSAQIQNDERQPLRSNSAAEQQNHNDDNSAENANPLIVGAKNRWHLRKFARRLIDWLRNFSPHWIGSICLCLLLLRLQCSQMQMEMGEEARLIMKSIDCTINRTMSEGIQLDWIDKQQYGSNIPETNPHIRREQLNGNTAARYCDLEQLDLRWYWAVAFLFGLNFLLIAVFLATFTLHSANFLTMEREFEAKKKIKMEMHEMSIRQHGKNRVPNWHSGGRNPLRATDDRSSYSGCYEQIPETSITSSMIPPSTVQYNESNTHPISATAAHFTEPPQNRPTPMNGFPNPSTTYPSVNTNGNTIYDYNHSPAASLMSNFSLPLNMHHLQQEFYKQYTNQFNACDCSPCTSHQAESLYAHLHRIDPTLDDTYNAKFDWWMGQIQKIRLSHSEPTIQDSRKSTEQIEHEMEGNGQTPGNEETKRAQQNGTNNSSSRRSRRRHRLDIRGLHKLRKDWQMRRNDGEKREAADTMNQYEDEWSQLYSTKLPLAISQLLSERNNPTAGSDSSAPIISQQTTNLQQPVQLLAPFLAAEDYYRMYLEHEFVSFLRQKQQNAAYYLCAAGNFAMMNTQQQPPQQNEEERPSTTSPTADEESSSNSSMVKRDSCEEKEEKTKHRNKKVQREEQHNVDDEEEETSLDPSSSSIPSSEVEDEKADGDSNDFDSDEEDEYEKQCWEERQKKLALTPNTNTSSAAENS